MAEKVGLFDRTKIFFAEVRSEISKVVWPTQQQVKTYTIVVIISAGIVSAIMGVWDIGINWVVQGIFRSA